MVDPKREYRFVAVEPYAEDDFTLYCNGRQKSFASESLEEALKTLLMQFDPSEVRRFWEKWKFYTEDDGRILKLRLPEIPHLRDPRPPFDLTVVDPSSAISALLRREAGRRMKQGECKAYPVLDRPKDLDAPHAFPFQLRDEQHNYVKLCCKECGESFAIFHMVRNAFLAQGGLRMRLLVRPRTGLIPAPDWMVSACKREPTLIDRLHADLRSLVRKTGPWKASKIPETLRRAYVVGATIKPVLTGVCIVNATNAELQIDVPTRDRMAVERLEVALGKRRPSALLLRNAYVPLKEPLDNRVLHLEKPPGAVRRIYFTKEPLGLKFYGEVHRQAGSTEPPTASETQSRFRWGGHRLTV